MNIEMVEPIISRSQRPLVLKVLFIISALVFFLFSINLLVASLSYYTEILQKTVLATTLDPFIGLFIGLLVTAIIQSSSTTSTLTVAMVATGTLTIQESVPIILGANIGTTLTSTIVSLGFISDREAFRKAISAGVIHDFYNIALVLILFPLELTYGLLSKFSIYLQEVLTGDGSIDSTFSPGSFLKMDLSRSIVDLVDNQLLMMLIAFVLLFASIKLLTNVIKASIIGDSKNRLKNFIFDKPIKSFTWGMGITAAIQSSSVASSLVVPLVATRKLKLINVFPFIVGANLGTTLTALIAASFSSKIALSIALTHLIFNLFGAIVFMSFRKCRSLLVKLTKRFSILVTKRRALVLAYVLISYFLIPLLLITLYKINHDMSARVGAAKNQQEIFSNKR